MRPRSSPYRRRWSSGPSSPTCPAAACTACWSRAGPGWGAGPVVYCAAAQAPTLHEGLDDAARVIAVPPPVELGAILADLSGRGVHRLLVEGGARLGREFLAAGL